LKSDDPQATKKWYTEHLGLATDDYGATFEWSELGNPDKKAHTVWSPFSKDTLYFAPSRKDFMINFRVDNLIEILDHLKTQGIEPIGEMQEYSYGKFAHILDPDGTKIELWEPIDDGFNETEEENANK